MRSVIWRYELRKALLSPILLALLALFIGFNLLYIMQQTYKRQDMAVVNTMAGQFGVRITDQMLAELEHYDQQQLAEMNALTNERAGKVYARRMIFSPMLILAKSFSSSRAYFWNLKSPAFIG